MKSEPIETDSEPDGLLFAVPETLSPRLEWMRGHDVRTHLQESTGDDWLPWSAWFPDQDWDSETPTCYDPEAEAAVGFGKTEMDAIVELAKRHGIKLWNEDGRGA